MQAVTWTKIVVSIFWMIYRQSPRVCTTQSSPTNPKLARSRLQVYSLHPLSVLSQRACTVVSTSNQMTMRLRTRLLCRSLRPSTKTRSCPLANDCTSRPRSRSRWKMLKTTAGTCLSARMSLSRMAGAEANTNVSGSSLRK